MPKGRLFSCVCRLNAAMSSLVFTVFSVKGTPLWVSSVRAWSQGEQPLAVYRVTGNLLTTCCNA